MISHFRVQNYKCLADVELPLTKLHVIIGQNDTGKTSLFEAMYAGITLLGNHIRNQQSSLNPFPGEWTGNELTWNNSNNGTVVFEYKSSPEFAQKISASSFQASVQFSKHEKDKSYQPKSYLFGNSELITSEGHMNLNMAGKIPTSYGDIFRANIFRFRPRFMARASALSIKPRYTVGEDGFGLPTLLSEIQDYDNRLLQKILESFQVYFPQYIGLRLENTQGWVRTQQNDGTSSDMLGGPIGKQVWLRTQQGEIRLQQASDGVVLLLGILALKFSPFAESLILIEEPENGVHPARLIEIVKLLRQLVEREQSAPQIILNTHSPLLLSEFQPEEVTLMRRMEDGSAKAFPLGKAKHIHERMQDKSQLGELWYYLSEDELLL